MQELWVFLLGLGIGGAIGGVSMWAALRVFVLNKREKLADSESLPKVD
jgi:hypothetical protein